MNQSTRKYRQFTSHWKLAVGELHEFKIKAEQGQDLETTLMSSGLDLASQNRQRQAACWQEPQSVHSAKATVSASRPVVDARSSISPADR